MRTTTVERRIVTQRSEDLLRLAAQAERNRVKILVDYRSGQHVATSASDPSRCYLVDAEHGCSCKGWAVWNRCQHHALLLSQLGRIPAGDFEPEPEPTVLTPIGSVATDRADNPYVVMVMAPSTTTRCQSCNGRGFTWAHEQGVQPFTRICMPCHGVGQVKVGVLVGERELRVVA